MVADNWCEVLHLPDLQPTVQHHPLLGISEEHLHVNILRDSHNASGAEQPGATLFEAHHLLHNSEHLGCKIPLQLCINISTDLTEQNGKRTLIVQ